MMMDTLKGIAAEMFRATLEGAGVAPDKIGAIVAALVDEHYPTDAQPVEIIEQEDPVVDFGDLTPVVQVMP
jgi:hypothetical protein